MDYLKGREWGLMVLDGKGLLTVRICECNGLHCIEVQTIPADKFRRVLSGNVLLC